MKHFLMVLIIFLLIPLPVLAEDKIFCVIVNTSVPINSITTTKLRNIYLGNKVTWDNNFPINVVKYKYPIEVHEEFVRRYMRMSPMQFYIHWRRLLHTGSHTNVLLVDNVFDMLETIETTWGSIGYIYDTYCNPNFTNINRLYVQ